MKRKNKIYSMILTSLFATLMCIGAWVHFPSVIPATMQTFVIMCALGIIGSKRTFIMLVIYLFMGVLGLPVFSGFTAGAGALVGPTAGFIWGFLLGIPIFYFVSEKNKKNTSLLYIGYILYIILHYITGALWYTYISVGDITFSGVLAASSITVLPFIVPDIIKMLLSVFIVKRIRRVFENKWGKE